MKRRCQTEGCLRECRSGYANCDEDTARLLSQAFGDARAVRHYVRRLSRRPGPDQLPAVER